MIIVIEFDYQTSPKSLLVEVQSPGNNVLLDLSQDIKTLRLNFELLIQNQNIDLKLSCNDLCIVDYPLTITNIVLDNFYQSKSILHRGKPNFSQEFVDYANKNQIFLDYNVNDSNRLDFTGQLAYQYKWPFYKNIFT